MKKYKIVLRATGTRFTVEARIIEPGPEFVVFKDDHDRIVALYRSELVESVNLVTE